MLSLRTLLVGLSLLGMIGCSGSTNEPWSQRKAHFEQAAVNARPLITAIKSYFEDVGKAPLFLSDITPKYIQQIPATGLKECPEFNYRAFPRRASVMVWYDLGSREGQPMKKLAKFTDGNQEHAILVLALDTEGKVVNAGTDRLPKDIEEIDFDAAKWKRKEGRMQMTTKLPDAYRLDGMPSHVFENLLGYPDGQKTLNNVLWELRIDCSTGFLNRDVFFYWPIQDYPPYIYSGDVELVADWAYVHD